VSDVADQRSFQVAGGVDAVGAGARRIAAVAQELGLPAYRTAGLRLAAHEVLVNAVEHGHLGDRDLSIDVEVVVDAAGTVTVRIADHALGGTWDPAGDPRAAPPAERGRGLQLAAASVDVLTIHTSPGRSEVTLVTHPGHPSGAAER
jgi:anti-sigma regulatory factor (Ser/Thr protein kinase)